MTRFVAIPILILLAGVFAKADIAKNPFNLCWELTVAETGQLKDKLTTLRTKFDVASKPATKDWNEFGIEFGQFPDASVCNPATDQSDVAPGKAVFRRIVIDITAPEKKSEWTFDVKFRRNGVQFMKSTFVYDISEAKVANLNDANIGTVVERLVTAIKTKLREPGTALLFYKEFVSTIARRYELLGTHVVLSLPYDRYWMLSKSVYTLTYKYKDVNVKGNYPYCGSLKTVANGIEAVPIDKDNALSGVLA